MKDLPVPVHDSSTKTDSEVYVHLDVPAGDFPYGVTFGYDPGPTNIRVLFDFNDADERKTVYNAKGFKARYGRKSGKVYEFYFTSVPAGESELTQFVQHFQRTGPRRKRFTRNVDLASATMGQIFTTIK